MKYRLVAALCVFAVAALLIAGCTQPATSGNITGLRIGYQPSTHQVAEMIAMDKGWFQQDLKPFGITNVTDYLFPTGAPEMQAMLANQLDVAYVGAAPVLSAVATGLDAKIVAGVNTQGSDLVLRTGLNYTGPQSLKGLKIATFQAGTIQDTILRDWLKRNNIDPEKDVSILGMGPGDAVTAITAGKVDAVFLPHPSPSVIEANGKGKIVVPSGQMIPDHTCCVLVVSGKLIREHPDIVTQIVRTHIRAGEFAANPANLNETAEIYARKNSADVEEIKKSLHDWDGSFNADPAVIVNSVMDYAKIQYDLGYLKTQLTKDQLFDLTFYQKAKAS